MTLGTAADTVKVWTEVKCAGTVVGELESLSVRYRRGTGGANQDNFAGAKWMNVLDMTAGTGTGGWLTGHIYASSSGPVRENHVVLAYGNLGEIVGSAITEDNRINEGYAASPGLFYMAVKSGTIDSLRVYGRTTYNLNNPATHYTQVAGPWTVTPGGTRWVDAAALIDGLSRTPTYPYASENVQVSAHMFKSGGSITRDSVRYQIGSGPWNLLAHDYVVADTYYFTIPAQGTGPVNYQFVCYDENSNIAVSGTQSYAIPLERTIAQLQFVADTTSGSGASPDSGHYVRTSGIVTGKVTNQRVYIGTQAGGPWSGLLLFRRADTLTTPVNVGDSVDVSGTAMEWNKLSEIDTIRRIEVKATGVAFDTTVVTVSQVRQEAFEGVLVQVDTVRMGGGSGTFGDNTMYHFVNAAIDSGHLYSTAGSQFVGTPIPTQWFRLVGNNGDYTSGRQVFPRVPSDIYEYVPDVAMTAILSPTDPVNDGDIVTPQVRVQNLSTINSTPGFNAQFHIGGSYSQTTGVPALAPGATADVSFPQWVATSSGSPFTVTTWTEMPGDPNTLNDTMWMTLHVNLHDAGADAIDAPANNVVLAPGTQITPAATVHNYGNVTEDIPVTFAFAGYSDLQTANSVAPGATASPTFASTTPAPGYYTMTATTSLPGDANAGNDVQTGHFLVLGQPVGLAPDGGWLSTPAVALDWDELAGTATYDVYVDDNSDFSSPEFSETGLVVSGTTTSALADGHYYWRVTGWNNLFGPWSATAEFDLDAGVPGQPTLLTPTDGATNVALQPVFTWTEVTFDRKTGLGAARGQTDAAPVTYQIQVATDGGFNHIIIDQSGLATESYTPGTQFDNATHYFWHVQASDGAGNTGEWSADFDFTTTDGLTPGWYPKPPVIGYPVGAGSAMARERGRIYEMKGNKTFEFNSYSPDDSSWTVLAPIPAGLKAVKAGGSMAAGTGKVFITKGNNTLEFYRFSIADSAWLPATKTVPLGTGKKVKAGTSMAFVRRSGHDFVYLLKGYGTEFYKYDVENDSFLALPNAPDGIKPKYDKGSWIAYDGDRYIYCMKAKYGVSGNEFYKFDVARDSWVLTPTLAPMPLGSQVTGKPRKKVADGSCADWGNGALYAFKGGNTQQFWKYLPDDSAGTWVELDTVPQVAHTGDRKKKVKTGAALAYYPDGGVFYAQKGNKGNQFWMYKPGTGVVFDTRPTRDGVAASGRLTIDDCRLSIAPNPPATGYAILRYSLPKSGVMMLNVYDVTGRSVITRTLNTGRTGSTALDLRNLSAGVYLVKLSSDGFSTSQKLVVEK